MTTPMVAPTAGETFLKQWGLPIGLGVAALIVLAAVK